MLHWNVNFEYLAKYSAYMNKTPFAMSPGISLGMTGLSVTAYYYYLCDQVYDQLNLN